MVSYLIERFPPFPNPTLEQLKQSLEQQHHQTQQHRSNKTGFLSASSATSSHHAHHQNYPGMVASGSHPSTPHHFAAGFAAAAVAAAAVGSLQHQEGNHQSQSPNGGLISGSNVANIASKNVSLASPLVALHQSEKRNNHSSSKLSCYFASKCGCQRDFLR